MKLKVFYRLVVVTGLGVSAGCASQNPNDERAKDFTAKQLSQVAQLLDDYAKSRSCDGYKLLARQEGEYPSDTTRRLQSWEVGVCGTRAHVIVMTLKVPREGWEVCISDRGPCGIVDSGLFKSD